MASHEHWRKWTAEEDDLLIELRNAGEEYDVIAKRIGRSRSAVTTRAAMLRDTSRITFRKNRKITDEEKARIYVLREFGWKGWQIAMKFGISENTVYALLRKGNVTRYQMPPEQAEK